MSELNNLIALTKLHISQNYEEKAWVLTDPDTYTYYRAFAQKGLKAQPQQSALKTQAAHPRKTPPAPRPAPQRPSVKKTPPPPTSSERPKSIERVSPKPADDVDFSDLIKILHTHFPGQKILDSQPDDTRAQEIAQKWKHPAIPPEVWILDSSRAPAEKLFLENIARAIETYFYPAAVLSLSEVNKEIIPRLILGTKELLNNVQSPSIQMESIPFYLESPHEKGRLWKHLKSTLQSS